MSKIEGLKEKLAELSVKLGTEIEPGETVKELEQQIKDAEIKLDKTGETGEGQQNTNQLDSDVNLVEVKAIKTIWTLHDGKIYRLTGRKTDKWPEPLAEQQQEAGNVEIL